MRRGWLKASWFRISVLSVCVAALVVIVYYQEQANNQRRIIECRNLGEKIEKEINAPDLFASRSKINPEYYYNPRLKKCFYCGGYYDLAAGTEYRVLIDAYTNKEQISFSASVRNPADIEKQDRWRFYKLQEQLFDEKKRR